MAVSMQSIKASRPAFVSRPARATTVKTQALFGWGKKDDEPDWKAIEKEEQFRLQQELREARKTGAYIKDANERRRKVASTLAERQALRAREKEDLAKGIIPETLKDWRNYKNKSDEIGTEGLIVPLLPFGRKEYDEGERFDLRSPYADMGWVDPDETDMWAGLKKIGSKILNFSGSNEEYRKQYGKPILWASDYNKQQAEKEAAAKQAAKDKKKGKK